MAMVLPPSILELFSIFTLTFVLSYSINSFLLIGLYFSTNSVKLPKKWSNHDSLE